MELSRKINKDNNLNSAYNNSNTNNNASFNVLWNNIGSTIVSIGSDECKVYINENDIDMIGIINSNNDKVNSAYEFVMKYFIVLDDDIETARKSKPRKCQILGSIDFDKDGWTKLNFKVQSPRPDSDVWISAMYMSRKNNVLFLLSSCAKYSRWEEGGRQFLLSSLKRQKTEAVRVREFFRSHEEGQGMLSIPINNDSMTLISSMYVARMQKGLDRNHIKTTIRHFCKQTLDDDFIDATLKSHEALVLLNNNVPISLAFFKKTTIDVVKPFMIYDDDVLEVVLVCSKNNGNMLMHFLLTMPTATQIRLLGFRYNYVYVESIDIAVDFYLKCGFVRLSDDDDSITVPMVAFTKAQAMKAPFYQHNNTTLGPN